MKPCLCCHLLDGVPHVEVCARCSELNAERSEIFARFNRDLNRNLDQHLAHHDARKIKGSMELDLPDPHEPEQSIEELFAELDAEGGRARALSAGERFIADTYPEVAFLIGNDKDFYRPLRPHLEARFPEVDELVWREVLGA